MHGISLCHAFCYVYNDYCYKFKCNGCTGTYLIITLKFNLYIYTINFLMFIKMSFKLTVKIKTNKNISINIQ